MLSLENFKRRITESFLDSIDENLEKKKPFLIKNIEKSNIGGNPEEIISWIAQADPVAVKSKNKKTPFVNKIMDWYLSNKIRLPEDIETVREILQKYNNAKQQGSVKPIEDYESPGHIRKDLDADAEEDNNYDANATLVDKDGEFRLYRIDDWSQGHICFADSGWCVKHENHFDEYEPPYFMVTKGKKRYALMHKGSYQIKDVYDDPLTLELARPIEKFVKKLWPNFEDEEDLIGIIGLWPDMVEKIKKIPEMAYNYAANVIKGRWPEAEPYIMKNHIAFYYARDVIKGRWPEAEPYIMKNPGYAYRYAHNVIKGRWPEAEPYIMKKPQWAEPYKSFVNNLSYRKIFQ